MASNITKPGRLLFILAVTVALGCSPSDSRSKPNIELPPDPAVVAKLQEIVNVRQRLFERSQESIKAGTVPNDGAAAIKLAEARMDLALEQHQREGVLAERKRIVTLLEDRLARAKGRGTVVPISEVDEIQVDLLNAQINLAREQAKSKP